MDFEKYLSADRQIPFEDAAAFSIELRRRPVESTPLPLTKQAKMGIMKLMMVKQAQGEDEQVQAAQDAAMLDPDVQRALDYQQSQAQASNLSQQVMAQQQQLEQMQQGMQQLQQQAEQAGQQAQMATQENQNLQSQLQGEMQMRQQANMQAMQAQDQAISTQAAAQQQRMQLTELADQMSLQLKQVASQDPVQAQQQQQQMEVQEAEAQKAQERAAMPAKQRKELEEAEKAQQEAQVQGQQAEQAQQQQQQTAPGGGGGGPMEQQAAAQQQQQAAQQAPPGGMVAQSSDGMSKVDALRSKLAACKAKHSDLRNARQSPVGDAIDMGKEKDAVLGKCSGCGCKVKKSEMDKHTCGGMKLASIPGASTPLKARLIEAGLGAGLGAATGLTYEAARQRFSRGVEGPTPEEIDLARRNRMAQMKVNTDPNIINRLAATKAQAQLDAEKDLRKNPKKALLRRALQGAIVGTAAAPSVMAAKRNLGPRIMGR